MRVDWRTRTCVGLGPSCCEYVLVAYRDEYGAKLENRNAPANDVIVYRWFESASAVVFMYQQQLRRNRRSSSTYQSRRRKSSSIAQPRTFLNCPNTSNAAQ